MKGYISALPLTWTRDENNHPNMNMILLTDNHHPSTAPVTAVATVQGSSKSQGAA
ncbi:hypothetical protein [Ideonella paludis]|uniref:hypothetical protein n=1 Tax=Ideonella paludis TaxID=1233411 RepID=UPI00362CDA03